MTTGSKKTSLLGYLGILVAVMTVIFALYLALSDEPKQALAVVTSDNYHLASIINAECGHCSDAEKYLIGSVVLNRAADSDAGIIKVLSEPSQFKGYLSDNYYCTYENENIATNLLFGIGRNWDVVYFYQGDPSWDDTLNVLTDTTLQHKFAY